MEASMDDAMKQLTGLFAQVLEKSIESGMQPPLIICAASPCGSVGAFRMPGSWHGPHTTDIPLRDIVDLVLTVNAGAYSVEAGNVRHEHEWRVWRDIPLPDGKLLIPGVVSHATNIVEHPQVVADRIVRYAQVVARYSR
jgi:hypothetical protein